MFGLMIKDLRILLHQKMILVAFVAIAFILSMQEGSSFIIGYVTFCSVMLVVGTLNYDEFDNGYPFLLSLPVTRKAYVAEKYVLSMIVIVGSWVLSLVLCFVSDTIQGNPLPVKETLVSSVIIILMPILLMNVMIPVQIKFGMEKGRLITVAIVGICAAIGYGIFNLKDDLGDTIAKVIDALDKIPDVAGCFIIIGIGLITALISFIISNAIMAKKEF